MWPEAAGAAALLLAVAEEEAELFAGEAEAVDWEEPQAATLRVRAITTAARVSTRLTTGTTGGDAAWITAVIRRAVRAVVGDDPVVSGGPRGPTVPIGFNSSSCFEPPRISAPRRANSRPSPTRI
jgi:hypothetical protein